MGATFHAVHGERFILGLRRGEKAAFKGMGIKVTTFEAMADYVDIYRRSWAGEAVNYDGPAGKFTHLAFADTYVGKRPEVWLAGYANDKGAECLVKSGFNGIILPRLSPRSWSPQPKSASGSHVNVSIAILRRSAWSSPSSPH